MQIITWKTPEYKHSKKTPDWYWAVGIVVGAIAIVSIIFGNFLFGILIILAFFSLSIYTLRPPKIVEVEINKIGIRIDTNLLPYQGLEGFWVEEIESGNKLLLKSKKLLMPLISFPIAEGVDTTLIKDVLSEKLIEEPLEEPFLEKLLEKFGF